MNKRKTILIISIIGMIASFPPQWYPLPLKVQLTSWFGASDYNPLPPSKSPVIKVSEPNCPEDVSGWRNSHTIDGIEVLETATCVADNPYLMSLINI